MPMVGYAHNEQNLEVGGGAETLHGFTDEDGNYSHSEEVFHPIPSDAAAYDTEWEGPWVGVRLQYSHGDNVFSLRAQYHDYDYDAVGDWKISPEVKHPKSFVDTADGDGYKVSANYAREFARNWDLIASLNYTKFESDSGTDTTFLADGSVDTEIFLGADWESYSASMGVTYKF